MAKDILYLELNIRVQNIYVRLKINIETHISGKPWLKVREDFLGCDTFNTKDGSQIRLWKNVWVGSKPLIEQFPNLYNRLYYPHITVANPMNQISLHITFRRVLVGKKLTTWHNLVAKITSHQLFEGRDSSIPGTCIDMAISIYGL